MPVTSNFKVFGLLSPSPMVSLDSLQHHQVSLLLAATTLGFVIVPTTTTSYFILTSQLAPGFLILDHPFEAPNQIFIEHYQGFHTRSRPPISLVRRDLLHVPSIKSLISVGQFARNNCLL